MHEATDLLNDILEAIADQGKHMGIAELLKDKRAQILVLARQHGAGNVRVYGSVARGDASKDSDVDLLVDVEPDIDIEFLGLWVDLEELLSRPVDLVTERSLRPRMRQRVLEEAVAV